MTIFFHRLFYQINPTEINEALLSELKLYIKFAMDYNVKYII